MSYTDVFGGSSVQPADVQYRAVALSASIVTVWPPFATTDNQCARIMKVTPSAGSLTVTMPDARLTSAGMDVLFDNPGAFAFTVLDATGAEITTLSAGQVKYLYLTDSSTLAGTWRVTLFGVGSSSVDAAQLAGLGLKALSGTISTAAVVSEVSSNVTVTTADRSKVFAWTGGSGTLTLPSTTGSTSDFAIEVHNQGSGTLTITPVGGVLIDGASTLSLVVTESCFIHMGASNWYTVGLGRNAQFNFTQLTQSVTGGTLALTLTQAANVVQTFTGALLSNQIITEPGVVQVYYVSNNTSGAYTLTFRCTPGGTSVVVPQGQAAILFCDGTNITNANTALAGGINSILLGSGSASAPSAAFLTSNTGFYSSGSNEIGVATNGAYSGKFTTAGYKTETTGAASLQSVSSGAQAMVVADRPAGSIGSYRTRTAGVDRWATEVTSTAESGSNAGSNYALQAYNDAGVLLGTAFTVNRATQVMTMTQPPVMTATSLTGTASININGTVGATTPAAGTFTTLTSTGNATLGDAEASDTHAIKGATTLLANSASAALTVTQTGAGNAFVVEDVASDTTPVTIDAVGNLLIGYPTQLTVTGAGSRIQGAGTGQEANIALVRYSDTAGTAPTLNMARARGSVVGTNALTQSGDVLGSINFGGGDGSALLSAAQISSLVDGTPGVNDMPGRLVFSTTADGASSPTERMRIDSNGSVGIGSTTGSGECLRVGTTVTTTATTFGYRNLPTINQSTTTTHFGVADQTQLLSPAALTDITRFYAAQGSFTGTAVNQHGFLAQSTLTSATNNYGFYSAIPAAANRYNFYAAGTADNYFAGSVGVGGVPVAGYKLLNYGSWTGGTTFYGTASQGTIQSDVTVAAIGFRGAVSTAAAAFTCSNIIHFLAEQGVIGVGSSVTNQFGYNSSTNLIGATNNYGFFAANTAAVTAGKVAIGFLSAVDTASGGGTTWGFYGAGTAQNYFAGNTGVGATPTTATTLALAAGTTAKSSLNLPHGSAPTSPVNGDMWTTTAGAFARINGVTTSLGSASSGLTLLATLTPTAAANIDFLNTFSATYDNYLIIGQGINFAADDGVNIRLAVAGSADAGSNYINSSGLLSGLVITAGDVRSAGKGAGFTIMVGNANATTGNKLVNVTSSWNSTVAGPVYSNTSSNNSYIAANAVTGFRLYSSFGANFAAAGKIRVYGYANT